MPTLNLLSSGCILEERFGKQSLLWTPSPEGYGGIKFGASQLGTDYIGVRMYFTKTYKTLTIQEPANDYCFICHFDHEPVDVKDICGVIIMKDYKDFAECQSFISDRHSYVQNIGTVESIEVTKDRIIEALKEILSSMDYNDKYVTYTINDGENIYPEQPKRSIAEILEELLSFTGDCYVEWQENDGTSVMVSKDSSGEVQVQAGAEGADKDILTSDSNNETFEDVMYHYIKVVKRRTVYSFFASVDGITWIEVGNTDLPDSHRIGFFMHAHGDTQNEVDENGIVVKDNGSKFIVYGAKFYSTNVMTVRNIPPGARIELVNTKTWEIYTESGRNNVSHEDNNVYIDTTLLNVPIGELSIMRIVRSDKKVLYEDWVNISGGNVYEFGYTLVVYVNNVPVRNEELFELDAFYDHDQVVRIDIHNHEQFKIDNLHVRISSYSVYYEGNETLGISLYDEAETEYDFSAKEVVIPEIMPSEGKSVLIKLTDDIIQDFYTKENKYRFKLDIF